jgi:exonuclease III
MRLRVVSWNMNHHFRREQADQQWAYLESLEPTIALLQEAPPPPPHRQAVFQDVRGAKLRTGIVGYGAVELEEIPVVPLGEDVPEGHLVTSRPGTFVAARAKLPGGSRITLISAYGVLSSVLTKTNYATTNVHRMLSDLTPLLDVQRSKLPLVFGGDLNISPEVPQPDTAAHVAVIDRIKAFGLDDCLGQHHPGRYVRTLRHMNKPDSKAYQIDWVFSSRKVRCIDARANDREEAWSLSDHCPVIADFETAD